MAAAPKTLKVTARPAVKDGAFWSTTINLFGDNPGTFTESFTVTTPDELLEAATAWAEALELPEGKDGFSLWIEKTSPRWPAGFKKLASRNLRVDRREEALAR